MKQYLADLELIIAQQRNYMMIEETMEADLADGECPPENDSQRKSIQDYKSMEEEESVPEAVVSLLKDTRETLRDPLNFYTFGIELNLDQRQRIFNNNYNRLLEKELVDQRELYEGLIGEVETQRALSKTFK